MSDVTRLAVDAQALAVTARQDAEQKREVAVEAKSIAEAAEEEGRRVLYATDMQLAPLPGLATNVRGGRVLRPRSQHRSLRDRLGTGTTRFHVTRGGSYQTREPPA